MMVCFKALKCWLSLDPTPSAPNGWDDKRKRIPNRLCTSESQPSLDAPLACVGELNFKASMQSQYANELNT